MILFSFLIISKAKSVITPMWFMRRPAAGCDERRGQAVDTAYRQTVHLSGTSTLHATLAGVREAE